MDALRFDLLTRSLATASSRRRLLRGLATLGLAAGFDPDAASARKRKKKLKLNEFGCVNVGGKCRGKDSACCSGLCQGKKPRKGKKDTSKCVSHDSGGCQAGQTFAGCGGTDVLCQTSASAKGACITTTGNAGYCSATTNCFPCQRDADCVPFCGLQTSCVICATGCASTGGTACAGPNPTSCVFPP